MFRSCAIMDMAHRGVLSVNGPERLAFLNGLLTNELISRDSGDPLPKGTYAVQVCPFNDPTVPFAPPGNYIGKTP